jgi:hypothetical protein
MLRAIICYVIETVKIYTTVSSTRLTHSFLVVHPKLDVPARDNREYSVVVLVAFYFFSEFGTFNSGTIRTNKEKWLANQNARKHKFNQRLEKKKQNKIKIEHNKSESQNKV